MHVQSHFLSFFKMSSESCLWVIVYHIVEVFLCFGDKLGKIDQEMFASQELLLLSIHLPHGISFHATYAYTSPFRDVVRICN